MPIRAVFTVEPGVDLPATGFGVRIEDELVITRKRFRPLPAALPRKLEDAEPRGQEGRRRSSQGRVT